MYNTVLWALLASLGTWGLTALGAAMVLFFKIPRQTNLNIMLGFSSGVMIAASFWSLLQPAIERAEECLSTPAYLVVSLGFLFGSLFIWLCDKIIMRAILKSNKQENNLSGKTNRIVMLILSITLHNIPEGLAVGVAFGLINEKNNFSAIMGAISIAIGIGLQNFPEGAAVSLPLRREGYSRKKSFFYGQISAIVEPFAAIVGALLVKTIETILPFALSFAAGAMILVVVHELIPECQQFNVKNNYKATMGIIAGFLIMMILDVTLG